MEEKKGELRVVKRSRREGRRAAVRRKVRRLRRLVPGGRELQPEQLFLRTAEYIYRLRLQVNVLRAISDLYPPSP
ncbi:uncharacterized protein LOC141836843 [Curcuma longa]|uniref:uncharacterized protein LOC141836843 n=1 Tax=Curcuma longa TaxID=136217 RepID=UPI003D9F9ED2